MHAYMHTHTNAHYTFTHTHTQFNIESQRQRLHRGQRHERHKGEWCDLWCTGTRTHEQVQLTAEQLKPITRLAKPHTASSCFFVQSVCVYCVNHCCAAFMNSTNYFISVKSRGHATNLFLRARSGTGIIIRGEHIIITCISKSAYNYYALLISHCEIVKRVIFIKDYSAVFNSGSKKEWRGPVQSQRKVWKAII